MVVQVESVLLGVQAIQDCPDSVTVSDTVSVTVRLVALPLFWLHTHVAPTPAGLAVVAVPAASPSSRNRAEEPAPTKTAV